MYLLRRFDIVLTIEVDDASPDPVESYRATLFSDQKPLFLGLVFVELQQRKQRCAYAWEDDCERVKAPPPVDVKQKPLGSFRASECGNHIW